MVIATIEQPVLIDYESKLEELVGGMDAPDAVSLGEEPEYSHNNKIDVVEELPYLVPWFTETDGSRRMYHNLAPDGMLCTFVVLPNSRTEVNM